MWSHFVCHIVSTWCRQKCVTDRWHPPCYAAVTVNHMPPAEWDISTQKQFFMFLLLFGTLLFSRARDIIKAGFKRKKNKSWLPSVDGSERTVAVNDTGILLLPFNVCCTNRAAPAQCHSGKPESDQAVLPPHCGPSLDPAWCFYNGKGALTSGHAVISCISWRPAVWWTSETV